MAFYPKKKKTGEDVLSEVEQMRNKLEELEGARDREIRANKAKSAFLARMSHEIRTPLNGILGMNTMILKESDDPSIIDYAQSIESAGRSLLSIVNDILDFSKIESGSMELVPTEYTLSSLVNDCYHMVHTRAKDKGLRFTVKVDPNLPYMMLGDEVRIRQIINNLLTNAIKYTVSGTVSLVIDGNQSGIDEFILRIRVKDTGIGIKDEDKERLFDAFTRVDAKKTHHIEGTGLGLQITSQLVELMGGDIRVESVYGEGSEFIATIKQKMITQKRIDQFVAGEESPTERHRKRDNTESFKAPDVCVLMVDDMSINIKVFKGFVKETRMQVDSATSGMQCLQMIKNKKYDIIFLDHMMPEMDGVETLKAIHDDLSHPNTDTPIIVMTANAIVGAKENYLKQGFTDYISKPLKDTALYRMLKKYITDDKIVSTDVDKSDRIARNDWINGLTFLDTTAGLSYCGGEKELYLDILKDYVNESRMGVMQSSFMSEDWKLYETTMHGLKNTSTTIGANDVSNLAAYMEKAAASKDVSVLRQNHGRMMMTYGQILNQIGSALALQMGNEMPDILKPPVGMPQMAPPPKHP